jgi:stage V sporulation protein D (sporulation-specific penicillin-binding protein)
MLDIKIINSYINKDGNNVQMYREPTLKALQQVFGIKKSEVQKILDDPKNDGNQYYTLREGLSVTEKKKLDSYTNADSDRLTKLTEKEWKNTYHEEWDQNKVNKLTEKEKEQKLSSWNAIYNRIRDDVINVKGIWLEEKYDRTYPMGSAACDTIGFTYDGTTADWGIEGYYNEILNGTNGRQYGYLNEDSDAEQTIVAATDGNSVVSTIDINVQQIIRNALQNYEDEMADNKGGNNGAKGVGVVVMNPDNGEVIGIDSDRWYDLNNPRDLRPFCSDSTLKKMTDNNMMEKLSEIWSNFCIAHNFEPGSIFKPVTAAAGLSTGTISPDTALSCNGSLQVEDKNIACEGSHGSINVGDAIKYSCNCAMMEIAHDMKEPDFLKYTKMFNFGMKTGIDLPGESDGVMFEADSMGPVELATSSFGQGFTCTMIQETAAISSVINGGYYYKPHIVREIKDSHGAVIKSIDPVLERRTNTEEVSAEIRKDMASVMSPEGTGYVAKIPGYTMGGKTGTAEKLPRGNGKYVLSFVCFAPVDHPQVCMCVTVDEPNIDAQETTIYAMSIARNIMVELLPYLHIFPDEEGYDTSNVDTTKVTNGLLLRHEYLMQANGIVPSHDSKTTLKGNKKTFFRDGTMQVASAADNSASEENTGQTGADEEKQESGQDDTGGAAQSWEMDLPQGANDTELFDNSGYLWDN